MYYAMTHDIGRRLGLEPMPQASAGDTRVETPLPLPPTSAPAPTGDTANSSPTAPVAQAAASPIAAMPATTANLLLPVQGVAASQLQDTFTDSRSEGRSHDAIDIMAPAGTPVLAVADGTVEKLFDSKQGGLTLYQFNPERTLAWYYAHLQGYAPGIAERKALKRGEVIGYVGSTGNANPEAPHLHFAIFVLGPEKQWWKGEAINPYPQLGGKPR
ncbi:MAG: M23 family peptidase [Lysobacteraceae bacterium]|nr:MAG: M23 family peptidase [Xanthomonadaceae bacterium]